jgi:uncharacterized membrane protein YgcG
MGPIPLLSSTGLTDLTRTITSADQKAIQRRLQSFERRFPQCQIHILVNTFSDTFPPASHLFWLFNSAGLSRTENRRGHNRDILIGIDPVQQWAGFIIGYGLEPFLGQEALDHILERASPRLDAGQTSDAISEIILHLGELMEGVCRDLPATLGLRENLAVEPGSNDY